MPTEREGSELEKILAEFNSERAKNSIIHLAISTGVSVPFHLVEKVAAEKLGVSNQPKFITAEIFERAGYVSLAHKLFAECLKEYALGKEDWFEDELAKAARKIGNEEMAGAFYQHMVSYWSEQRDFSMALKQAVEWGNGVKEVYQEGVRFHLKEGSLVRMWRKKLTGTRREKEGCSSARHHDLNKAAELSVMMGDWQQAIKVYCQNKDFLTAAKLSELIGKDKQTVEKLYRKEISFLKRKNFYAPAKLALMLGDLELAANLKLSDGDYHSAAELALKSGNEDKARDIIRKGIDFHLERSMGNIHEEERGTIRRLIFKQRERVRWFINRTQMRDPQLAYSALLWQLDQERSLPSYKRAVEHLEKVAELYELIKDNKTAYSYHIQALILQKKADSSDYLKIVKLAKKANNQKDFNWAYNQLMAQERKRAEEWPESASIHFQLAAKWAEELGDEKDAILFYKLAGNFVEAARVHLKTGRKEDALQCYDEGGDLVETVYSAADLALELGKTEIAKKIFSRAAPKLIEEETRSYSHYLRVSKYALSVGDSSLARTAYQKSLKSIEQYGLGNLNEHKAGLMVTLADQSADLGDTGKEKVFRKISAWVQIQWDNYLQSNRNFFLETNPNEPYEVRSTEAHLRELMNFYETKVKPGRI